MPHRGHRDQPATTCVAALADAGVRRAARCTRACSSDAVVRAATASRCSTPARRPPCRTARAALGYWDVGVPPSGPMDALSFRLGQPARRQRRRTPPGSSARLTGPTLRFHRAAVVALTGRRHGRDARRRAASSASAPSGAGRARCSTIGHVARPGQPRLPRRARRHRRRRRISAAARRSRSDVRRPRRAGAARRATSCTRRAAAGSRRSRPLLPAALIPQLTRRAGRSRARRARTARPTSSPTTTSRRSTRPPWQVHHNSSRTGVRLIGPKPRWARPDGGEAGLHPSNIHDNAVRGRHRRLHRRHADHPRPRRAQPGRLRLPGDDHRRPTAGRSGSSRPATPCASCPCRWWRRGGAAGAAARD